jgi:hypothetical protein
MQADERGKNAYEKFVPIRGETHLNDFNNIQ